MAYDTELVDRTPELLATERGVEVGAPPACGGKRMFGGLAFLINGNMSVAASGQGGLLVRVPRTTPTDCWAARMSVQW